MMNLYNSKKNTKTQDVKAKMQQVRTNKRMIAYVKGMAELQARKEGKN